MTDRSELKDRLEAALDRIASAADGLAAMSTDAVEESSEEHAELQAELEAERVANAQLEERVKAIKERQESQVADLEREVDELKTALAARDGAVRHVRQTNGKLRRANRALRTANAQGVSDPGLINESMVAELEALRALQAADRAELDDVLSVLEPIVAEAANA